MTIAVFLPNWIGDAVMATPALRALRNHYRDARLIGVMKPYVADVFEGGDWFDDIVLAGGGSRSQGVLAVAWRLRRLGVEGAVLLPNTFRSALTAWLGGCQRRIGYARYGRSLLLTDALEPVRDEVGGLKPSPVLDAYNRLAERAGCPRPTKLMELFTTSADERAADRVWERASLEDYPEVICLNPGAAFGAAKHWPTAYFATLAHRLAEQRRSAVLVLCGPRRARIGAGYRDTVLSSERALPGRSDGPKGGGRTSLVAGTDQGMCAPGRSAGDDRQRAAPFRGRLRQAGRDAVRADAHRLDRDVSSARRSPAKAGGLRPVPETRLPGGSSLHVAADARGSVQRR